ncbi:hypothetical protein C882_2967 [Caenispirillum salinarum AK4]|uniref:Uncharacterized protein n=1 Tax=Caenispirillum salinarum AK4 TaxID=1238182 RepID=K9HNJ4_9PROT|nr:hypothetical protein [Caenispirillum salinarum]EKV31903.1 hypothetical protein C882_2967 [Caenispirillum salinarum AK4]
MHQAQAEARYSLSVASTTASCAHRSADLGCPVDTRVENRLPEMMTRGLRDEAVEMALDAAHIGVLCERTCPAVEPLLETVGRAAQQEAADPDGLLGDTGAAVVRSPTLKRLNALPGQASEPARHAFLLVRAAYRLRQARTAETLWQAVDANLGCWIALRTAVADGRVALPASRRRQVVQYADYVEQMTRTTRPMCDRTVEAFIRLDRNVAKWLTEDATDRVATAHGAHLMAAE